jgi:hypothetical protein
MKLLSEAGTLDAENMQVSGKMVQGQFRIPGKSSYVVIARTTPHAFQLSAKDFSAYLKEEGLEETLRWREEHGEAQLPGRERYAKYAKSLLTSGGDNEFHTRPTNLAMEIVPETSPYDLKPGATLPVKVLLRWSARRERSSGNLAGARRFSDQDLNSWPHRSAGKNPSPHDGIWQMENSFGSDETLPGAGHRGPGK